VADGGATYTVNIELATRQFSQDLRNLKTKIQNELGKAVKVGGKQGTTAQQRAQELRERRKAEEDQRRTRYNVDRNKAFQVRQGRAVSANLKLEKLGLDVQERKIQLGEASKASQRGEIQFAESKLKILNEEIEGEFKVLDLINKQAAAEKKALIDKENAARKLENRARKGRYGQRMHGPIDRHGTQIYDGYKNPPIPKRGAALPIDLQRKGTGTFATSHTRLLRRRQNLETLLSTFEGISSPEINNFKKGIQGLVKQYGAISTSMGQTKNASGFGNAGEIGRQLKDLDNLTHREEQRAKRIQITSKKELEFLNQKHRIEKLLAKFDKKGVNTTSKRLQLEKAITAQDKQQLDSLLRQFEIENIGLKGVSGTGRGRGKSKGTPYSPFNQSSPYFPRKAGGGRGARVAQSALISGGFPLLFGQNPLVAGLGAAGGAIGESLSPGGGFAGGIAATAISTVLGNALTSVKNLSEALNPLKFNADKAVEALGFLNSERAREIKLIEKTRGSNAALLEVQKDLQERYGPSGLLALQNFDSGWSKFMKGFKTSLTDVKVSFAEFVDSISSDEEKMKKLGLTSLSKDNSLVQQYESLTQQIAAISNTGAGLVGNLQAGNLETTGFMGSGTPRLTRQGKARISALETERDKLIPGLVSAGIDAKSLEIVGNYNAKFKEQVYMQEYNLDIQKRILDLRSKGINPAIAKTMVTLEQMNDTTIDLLNNKAQALEADIQSGDLSVKDRETKILALEVLKEQITDQKVLNQLKIDGIVANMEANAAAEKQLALWKDIGSTIKSGLVDGINAAIDGSKTLGEVANNVLRSIANKLLNYGIDAFLGGIPGFDKFFKAKGGPVKGGSPYIVGEKGPELFVPGSSGNIVPNHDLGGGGSSVVVNVDASGSSVQGDTGQAEELGSMLAAAIQSELVNQQRPGGLLY